MTYRKNRRRAPCSVSHYRFLRVRGALAFGLLFLLACDPAEEPQEVAQSVSFSLTGKRGGGSSLQVTPESGQTCVTLMEEAAAAKAAHLHFDRSSANDPLVATLFEPPDTPGAGEMCATTLSQEEAGNLIANPSSYYLDLHFSPRGDPLVLQLMPREPSP